MFSRAAHEEGDSGGQEPEGVGENDVLIRFDTGIDNLQVKLTDTVQSAIWIRRKPRLSMVWYECPLTLAQSLSEVVSRMSVLN